MSTENAHDLEKNNKIFIDIKTSFDSSGLTLAIDYNRDRSLSGFSDQSSPRFALDSNGIVKTINTGVEA